jgi:O-antigen/teichoic acid export membrane protein
MSVQAESRSRKMVGDGGELPGDSSDPPVGRAHSRSFLSNAAIYGLGTLLLQMANVVLLPLYTRYLSPADFGTLEILNRTGQIIGIFFMVNGIVSATFTFYCQAKTAEERQRVTSSLLALSGILLLGGGFLVVTFAQPLGSLLGVAGASLTAIGILVPFFDATVLIPMLLLQARTQSVFFICVSLAMFICRVIMLVIAVACLGWGIWGVLGASIANAALFGAALNLRELWKQPFRPDVQIMCNAARFGFPFLFTGICGFIATAGDRFFLAKTVGVDELGVYALGYKLALAVGVVSFTPLFKVWSVRVYGVLVQHDAAVRFGHVFTLILGAYLFVGLGLCAFIDDVVALLASPAYRKASSVVAPLVLAQFFCCAATLMDGVFYAFRETRWKAWLALASAGVMCTLYAILIPRFGATGAAYASLGGFAFHAAATLGISQRVFRIQYETARLAAMLCSAIGLVVASRWLSGDVHSLLLKGLLVAFWPALMWRLGILSIQDKRQILATIGPALDMFRRPIPPFKL